MVEKAISMSAPMVRALPRKSLTRRIVAETGIWGVGDFAEPVVGAVRKVYSHGKHVGNRDVIVRCPYGQPGDRLWVREAFTFINVDRDLNLICIAYDADGPDLPTRVDIKVTPEQLADFMGDERDKIDPFHRRRYPAMFMNRFFSRHTLEVTGVRVERLQDISAEDAIAEGIEPIVSMGTYRTFANYSAGLPVHLLPIDSYRTLWESIHGPGSWKINPMVWVVAFKHVTPKEVV